MSNYEELIKNLRSVKDTWQTQEEEWMLQAADAIEKLMALTAVDAKPVVLCKDCKYYEEHHYEREGEPPYIKGKCGNKFGLNRQYMVHPDEFCSRGERKE